MSEIERPCFDVDRPVNALDEIEPGLYLGGVIAAEDDKLLQSLKITHVLTVDCFQLKTMHLETIENLFLYANDRSDFDLLSHFDETNAFIQNSLEKGGKCLVHCFGGVSRSSTIVIAYLMQKYDLTLEQALKKVKEKRCCISPNPGFISQLKLFESMKCILDKTNVRYRLYLLSHMAGDLVTGRAAVVPQCFDLSEHASGANSYLSCQFKCKKCRNFLFNHDSLLFHYIGIDPKWDNDESDPEQSTCKDSIFIDPLPWMIKGDLSFQGKILCPKCNSKFGTYNWGGLVCPCGARVVPGFKITESRVDKVVY